MERERFGFVSFEGKVARWSINGAIKGRRSVKARIVIDEGFPGEIPFRFNNSRVHAAVTRVLIKRELKCSPVHCKYASRDTFYAVIALQFISCFDNEYA